MKLRNSMAISLLFIGLIGSLFLFNCNMVYANGSSGYLGNVGDWYIGEVILGSGVWNTGDQIRIEVVEKNNSRIGGVVETYFGFAIYGDAIYTEVSLKKYDESEFTYLYTDFAGVINESDPNLATLGGYMFNYTSNIPNAWYPSNFTLWNHSMYSFLTNLGVNNSEIVYSDEVNNATYWEGYANGSGANVNDHRYDWGYENEKGVPAHAIAYLWNGTEWNLNPVAFLFNGSSWTLISSGSIIPPDLTLMQILVLTSTGVILIGVIFYLSRGTELLSKKVKLIQY